MSPRRIGSQSTRPPPAASGTSPHNGRANPSSAATGAVTGFAGKCVNVAGANSTNGTQVQLFTCNGTAAQQWTVAADGSLQALGKCLDVAAAGTANGTKVQIYDCNGTGAQRWQASNGSLVNANSGNCLDVTGVNSADGTPLQIWTLPGGSSGSFVHPGVLNSQAQLDFIRGRVLAGAQPWTNAYNSMRGSRYASLSRVPAPRPVVECGSFSNPNNGCTDEREDAIAAYTDALMWYITAWGSRWPTRRPSP